MKTMAERGDDSMLIAMNHWGKTNNPHTVLFQTDIIAFKCNIVSVFVIKTNEIKDNLNNT